MILNSDIKTKIFTFFYNIFFFNYAQFSCIDEDESMLQTNSKTQRNS